MLLEILFNAIRKICVSLLNMRLTKWSDHSQKRWLNRPQFAIEDKRKGCYIPVRLSDDCTPIAVSEPPRPHLAAPVKQVALNRKATSPLMPQQSETRHTNSLKGRSSRFITPLHLVAYLPRELPSQRWQQFPST